jgi:ABC-type Fe3+ transport system permease subunit
LTVGKDLTLNCLRLTTRQFVSGVWWKSRPYIGQSMKIGKPVSTAINVAFVVVLATAVFQRVAHDRFWPALALALICIGMIVVAIPLQGRVMGANAERVQSGPNSGMQRSADHQDILDASPAYIRAAAIVCVALSAIGLSVSTHV